MPVLIVSGSPGSGKTTLCHYLANADPAGVHLETDRFFRFLSHRIDPSMPESRAQNETIARAYSAAAKTYSEGGYSVYLDGVIGPWLIPLVAPILPECDFILLHAPLDVVLARIDNRPGQSSASAAMATRMHRQFEAILSSCRDHVVQTDGSTPQRIAQELQARRATGQLSVSKVSVPE